MTSQIGKRLDHGVGYSQILKELQSGGSDQEGDLNLVKDYLNETELIFNDKKRRKNFFKVLKEEMLTSEQIDFMVSFIRMSGVQLLIPVFLEESV
jgi:HKD family nuclease